MEELKKATFLDSIKTSRVSISLTNEAKEVLTKMMKNDNIGSGNIGVYVSQMIIEVYNKRVIKKTHLDNQ